MFDRKCFWNMPLEYKWYINNELKNIAFSKWTKFSWRIKKLMKDLFGLQYKQHK